MSIRSFRDLEVYRNAYQLSLDVAKNILPLLPPRERFDLTDQLSRSTKAIPRLIAEGYAKKHQKAGFQKYLDDAMAESNETLVGLEHCRDIYEISSAEVDRCIDLYDKTSRQLYKLSMAWSQFKKRPNPANETDTRVANEKRGDDVPR
jgi:four helix bundle protein